MANSWEVVVDAGVREAPFVGRRPGAALFVWVLACTAGGVAGGMAYLLSFFGDLILFGAVFALGQWIFLRARMRGAGLWVLASALSWPAGSITSVWAQGALGEGAWNSVARWTGNGDLLYVLLEPVTWTVYGLGQGLALGVLLGRRYPHALWWVPASVAGGVAWTVMQSLPSLAGGIYEFVDGLSPILALLVTSVSGGALYGLVTGPVMVFRVLQDLPSPGSPPPERRPPAGRRPGRGWLAVSMSLVLAGLSVGGALLYSRAMGCSPDERAVFGEFPQYGGLEVEPESNLEVGSCAVYYETPDSEEQARAYFAAQLRSRGWKVEIPEPPPETTPEGEPFAGGDLLWATRDGYLYSISYQSLESYIEPRPGVHLAVHVSRG